MQVQSINNSQFCFGQKKYLDSKTYGYLKDLLPKMNKETVYVSNDTNYKSSFLKSLLVDDFKLTDGRCFLKQVPENEQLQKETLIRCGNAQLVINNKDGEIIECDKSAIMPWDKLLKKVSDYIKLIAENFEDTGRIYRFRLNNSGLTEEGSAKQKRLEEEFEKLESEKINKEYLK